MMSKWVQATNVSPPVICPTCNREMPRTRTPVPEGMVLRYDEMQWIEKRLLVGLWLDHRRGSRGRGEYAEWDPMSIARVCLFKYKQAANALRRLKVTRWVQTVTRGVYRLTPETVESLDGLLPSTIKVTDVVRARPGRRKKK